MHYNEIIRQTGKPGKKPDRTHIDNAIDELEHAQLIKEFKMSKRERKLRGIHSQAKVFEPTNLGCLIIGLTDDVDKYNESYNELKKVVRENFDISPDTPKKELIDTLGPRGWNKEEISKYKVFYEGAMTLLSELSPRENMDALLTRYVSLLSQHDIIENEFAMIVLNNVIMDLLSKQISFIREDIVDRRTNLQHGGDEGQERGLFDSVPEVKIGVLDYIFANEKSLEIRFTNEEAKQVLSAILNIFRPSKKALERRRSYDSAVGEVVSTYIEGL
jgi:hypothetical protein